MKNVPQGRSISTESVLSLHQMPNMNPVSVIVSRIANGRCVRNPWSIVLGPVLELLSADYKSFEN